MTGKRLAALNVPHGDPRWNGLLQGPLAFWNHGEGPWCHPKALSSQIAFQFAGGTNLDPKKDKHMHEAKLTILDDDHIEFAGVAWENGGPAKKQCCDGMKLVRRK